MNFEDIIFYIMSWFFGVIGVGIVFLFVFLLADLIMYGDHPKPYVDIIEKEVNGQLVITRQKRYRSHIKGMYHVKCEQCDNPDLADANEYRPPAQTHIVYGAGVNITPRGW